MPGGKGLTWPICPSLSLALSLLDRPLHYFTRQGKASGWERVKICRLIGSMTHYTFFYQLKLFLITLAAGY